MFKGGLRYFIFQVENLWKGGPKKVYGSCKGGGRRKFYSSAHQVPILGQPIILRIEYFTGERHETKIKAPTIKHSLSVFTYGFRVWEFISEVVYMVTETDFTAHWELPANHFTAVISMAVKRDI